ncbi:MAG: AAA family ATPase [Gemmataceae bacterium]|nr:AAA family ATPase [Gemmataceae bacterium]
MLRAPAEVLYAEELEQLTKEDKHPRPPGWRMSPRAVLTYIIGGKAGAMPITPKYIGHNRLVEIAISTLVTDRSLLLIGEPGTAKSWLSEHLAAAVNGDSTKVVQSTAGTTEEHIRYTWNYALLIARGPRSCGQSTGASEPRGRRPDGGTRGSWCPACRTGWPPAGTA